ncbi:MAG: InlB B-repeat-containing protein [Eubacteriales bacterium]|nr:InlB B-repeat-containing protein [Eubacteriales bacterium]
MKTSKHFRMAITVAAILALGSMLLPATALAETKSIAHGGTIYLGRSDNGTPESRTFRGPAGIPANALISKVRVEISGQKYAGESGASATGTYLSVKVNNAAQNFAFNLGQPSTIGKDYLAVDGLDPTFDIQVTGYGEEFQTSPALGFGGGLIVQSCTGIFSLKIIVTYSAWYTVTWKSGDAVLRTDENLPSLAVPAYGGTLPTRAADAQYTYLGFLGWEPAIVPVVEDAVYQAVFEKTVNTYTVTWKNGETVLETDQGVPYGTMPEYSGPTPQREATAQYAYTFQGWAPEVSAVAGTSAYEALFAQEAQIYTLRFDSAGGTAAAAITQGYGTPVTAPDDPARAGYTFQGWDPEVPPLMPAGDLACTAQWQPNAYRITFDSAGGSPVSPIDTHYGETVTPPPEPTRTGYTFDGWLPGLPEAMTAGNLSCTAQWLRNMYTVEYLPGSQGTFPVRYQHVYYNASLPAIDFEITGKAGYAFDGWDPALPAKMPGAYSIHTARWIEEGNLGSAPGTLQTTLSFDSAGGSPLASITAAAGAPLTLPEPPQRDGYVFTGWAPAFPAAMPENGLTCVAQWEREAIHYPNNTLCAQGLRLRDIAPERTGKWQMFTPLDLANGAEQTLPLIASNLYFAGEAKVRVQGGSVTVSYSLLNGVELKSEFLAILPNLDAATTTDPAGLKAYQYAFGQPIHIENDLGVDTRVVLYIMNVVDYHSGLKGLRLFTDRNPLYQEAAKAYQALLD